MQRLLAAAFVCLLMGSGSVSAREFDAETGLVRMGARDYDPRTGRFLQEDPAPPFHVTGLKAEPQQMNLYAYALNNPLLYTDPFGLRPLTPRERLLLQPYIPKIDLQKADIHEDKVPWYLSKKYDAITRGNNIYFRPGVYDPASHAGIALLGHELVHVGQYRKGTNAIKFLWSYRRGYARSKYELDADAIQQKILLGLPPTLPPLEPAPAACE